MARSHAKARFLRVAVAFALLAAGAGLLIGSLVSFETYASHVHGDTYAYGELSSQRFSGFVARSQIMGVSAAIASLLLLCGGRRVDGATECVAVAWTVSLRQAPRRLVNLVDVIGAAEAISLAGVIVVGAALRIAYLGVPLRYDEATTWLSYVSKPLYVGLSNYSAPNNHLLNTALAKLSVTALGDSPTALRLPALLAAIATIPAVYALAFHLYGRAAALLASGLVASSSTLVEYSANSRGYSLVVLLTLVALIAGTRAIGRDSLPAWTVVTVALGLGLYAVPTMLYSAVGVLLWIALSQLVDRRPAARVLTRTAICAAATSGLTLILYAPVLVVSGPQAVTANEFVTPVSFPDLLGRLPAHLSDILQSWTRDVSGPVAVALAVLLLVSLVLTPRLSSVALSPLAPLVVAGIAVVFAQRAVPFTRTWLYLAPVAAATIAGLPGGFLDRARRAQGNRLSIVAAPALALLIALAGATAVLAADSPRTSRETGGLLDAPLIATYLSALVTSNDRILATGSDTILAYYLDREGVDAEPLIFGDVPLRRTYVVVNTLGKQTLQGVLADLGEPRARYGPARLLKRWESAQLYVLAHR